MQFIFSPELREYVQKKGNLSIIIEVVSCDTSDLEVTELHTHFVNQKQAELFVRRKHFQRIPTDCCPVLLPNYRLEYKPEVSFSLKKIGPFHLVKVTGVDL